MNSEFVFVEAGLATVGWKSSLVQPQTGKRGLHFAGGYLTASWLSRGGISSMGLAWFTTPSQTEAAEFEHPMVEAVGLFF